MTKKQLYGKLLAVLVGGLLVCSACHHTDTSGAEYLFRNEWLPFGDAAFLKGVSALYAGITEDRLIMAGGMENIFPDIPVADGGKRFFIMKFMLHLYHQIQPSGGSKLAFCL